MISYFYLECTPIPATSNSEIHKIIFRKFDLNFLAANRCKQTVTVAIAHPFNSHTLHKDLNAGIATSSY